MMRNEARCRIDLSVVPAGSPARWRWNRRNDMLHIYLEQRLVSRVAAVLALQASMSLRS
jgi:hypothetical protein